MDKASAQFDAFRKQFADFAFEYICCVEDCQDINLTLLAHQMKPLHTILLSSINGYNHLLVQR